MKILYVARHDQPNSADDEGAIFHALTQLGHHVERCHESCGDKARRTNCDFLLFHHWQDYASIEQFGIPKVAWTFDLINWPADPTLKHRCKQRKEWMWELIPRVNLCFMTDGDFVAGDASGKCIWLPQGADGRIVGRGADIAGQAMSKVPILFTGIGKSGGTIRESFVAEMQAKYGSMFVHVSRGCYREKLAERIAGADIVVAPDGPVTNKYWSNRVYTALGFGACLVHPYCSELAKQYEDGKEIMFYRSRGELHVIIEMLLEDKAWRTSLGNAGLLRTQAEHLYRHRCEQLVRVVKERLF